MQLDETTAVVTYAARGSTIRRVVRTIRKRRRSTRSYGQQRNMPPGRTTFATWSRWRKAQEALAGANARLAAANQAREEAEADAKNARSVSDDAGEGRRGEEVSG